MPGQRIADLRQAVDPDVVVERRAAPAPAFLRSHSGASSSGSSITSRRPRTQACPAAFSMARVSVDLAAQAERLLVDDEEVGIEDLRRVLG